MLMPKNTSIDLRNPPPGNIDWVVRFDKVDPNKCDHGAELMGRTEWDRCENCSATVSAHTWIVAVQLAKAKYGENVTVEVMP